MPHILLHIRRKPDRHHRLIGIVGLQPDDPFDRPRRVMKVRVKDGLEIGPLARRNDGIEFFCSLQYLLSHGVFYHIGFNLYFNFRGCEIIGVEIDKSHKIDLTTGHS
jgi:hypothetical protein